ncbi:MAG: hypothetical protein K2M05_03950 [Paramuribaculum sp.]|nr:hypothetical protein [Paramuribaculum sp.]MDE6303722.1 hypothetical protein [Paramuribaculum sp.]
MKKSLLVLAGAAVAVSASAAGPRVINNADQPSQAASELKQVVNRVDDPALMPTVVEHVAKPAAVQPAGEIPAAATLNVSYFTPPMIFYPIMNMSVNGEDGYYSPLDPVVAPIYNNLWLNNSHYYDPTTGRFTSIAKEGYDFTWDYMNGKKQSNDIDLSFGATPYFMTLYGQTVPTLEYDGQQYATPSGNNDMFIIYGGNGNPGDTYMNAVCNANGWSDPTYGGAYPYHAGSANPNFFGNFRSFVFHGGSAGQATMNQQWEKAYADQGLSDVVVSGFVQRFDAPAAPYALSYVNFNATVQCEAGATLTFTFISLDENGNTDEVLYKTAYTFSSACPADSYQSIHVDLTTDDGVEELNYVLIDCPMIMVVSGFTDEKFISFQPSIGGMYCKSYGSMAADEHHEILPVNEQVAAVVEGTYQGETHSFVLNFPYLASFSTGAVCYYASFNMTLGIEYPYVAPFYCYNTQEDYEALDIVNVWPAEGEMVWDYMILTDAKADDVIISTADGDDLPSWLSVIVEDPTDDEIADYRANLSNPYVEPRYLNVEFNLGDNASAIQSTDVVITYKGQSATFHVSATAESGIDAVKADVINESEVVANQYFDLTGRQLSAQPESGLCIRRATMANGKVITVKVAR